MAVQEELIEQLDIALGEWHRLDNILYDPTIISRKDIVNQRDRFREDITNLSIEILGHLKATNNGLDAELAFSDLYREIRIKYENRNQNHWIDHITYIVVETLKTNALEKLRNATNPKDRETNKLIITLSQEESYLRKSTLQRIIRGFMVDFIHQTQEGIIPCNIRHNRNPKAAMEWSKHTPKEFHTAAAPGLFHAAASFNAIKHYQNQLHSSPPYHALGQIIKTATEIFSTEYKKIDSACEPKASVYNDENSLIALAHRLDEVAKSKENRLRR